MFLHLCRSVMWTKMWRIQLIRLSKHSLQAIVCFTSRGLLRSNTSGPFSTLIWKPGLPFHGRRHQWSQDYFLSGFHSCWSHKFSFQSWVTILRRQQQRYLPKGDKIIFHLDFFPPCPLEKRNQPAPSESSVVEDDSSNYTRLSMPAGEFA